MVVDPAQALAVLETPPCEIEVIDSEQQAQRSLRDLAGKLGALEEHPDEKVSRLAKATKSQLARVYAEVSLVGRTTFDNADNPYRARFGTMDAVTRDTAAPYSFIAEAADDIADAVQKIGEEVEEKFRGVKWDKPSVADIELVNESLGRFQKVLEQTTLILAMLRRIRGGPDANAEGAAGAGVPAEPVPGGDVEVRHQAGDGPGPGAAARAG